MKLGCDHPGSDRRIYQELTEKSPSLFQAAARDRQLPILHKKGAVGQPDGEQLLQCGQVFHGIGGEQTFLDVSALFTRSVNSWFSPFSGIQKRDQGAGCREAAALKNSKKQKKTFTVQAISNIILSLAVSAGAENEPEWTVTEHMDGTPMYIAPENRLRIW